MTRIFLNNNGNLRSGWRVSAFLLVFVPLAILFGFLEGIAFSGSDQNNSYNFLTYIAINSLVLLLLAIGLGAIAGRLLDHVPFRALGVSFTPNWLKHFGLGSAAGILALSLAVLIAFASGGERFELNLANGIEPILWSLAASLVVYGLASAFEEALFRGYLLQTFARSGLAWLAILLTSLFFGAVHMGNPNATAVSVINTVLAGVWFSLAYMRTRDLWFVWGMHLMWNWIQGSFFGIEVSGLTKLSPMPLFREIDTGPVWLTGESYGIEGSLACTVAIITSMAVIYFWPALKPDEEMVELTRSENHI